MSSNIQVQKICEFCGIEYTARTTATRYCSHNCNRKAYKANLRQKKIKNTVKDVEQVKAKPIIDLRQKDFLTVNEVSRLLNISTRTLYRLISDNKIPAINFSKRKTLVRRSDIENIFDAATPPILPKIEQPVKESDWYTYDEVYTKFNASASFLHTLIKKHNIPKKKEGIFAFVSKKHIDELLNPQNNERNSKGKKD